MYVKLLAGFIVQVIYIFATWSRVVCLVYTPEAQGPVALGLLMYISGRPQVPMLQLLCNTSSASQLAPAKTSAKLQQLYL